MVNGTGTIDTTMLWLKPFGPGLPFHFRYKVAVDLPGVQK